LNSEARGARLVDRTTRSVSLTTAGERLRAELAAVLPRLDAALRTVKEADVLRLGFTWPLPAHATHPLGQALERYVRGAGDLGGPRG
jgi:DNA-binding transcriptional LysR family regulator